MLTAKEAPTNHDSRTAICFTAPGSAAGDEPTTRGIVGRKARSTRVKGDELSHHEAGVPTSSKCSKCLGLQTAKIVCPLAPSFLLAGRPRITTEEMPISVLSSATRELETGGCTRERPSFIRLDSSTLHLHLHLHLPVPAIGISMHPRPCDLYKL